MATPDLLQSFGALVTAGLGFMGLVNPRAAARLTRLSPRGKDGISEIRATFGGFFLALGITCLVTHAPMAFHLTGLAWLGAAAGRLVSVAADGNRSPRNLGAIFFEGIIGLLLLAAFRPFL